LRTLHDELLFALPGTERFLRTHQLCENWFDARPGASFLDNPANEVLLAPWRHWLLAHVDSHPATSALTLGAGGTEPRWHTPGIRQYLLLKFLVLVQPLARILRRQLLSDYAPADPVHAGLQSSSRGPDGDCHDDDHSSNTSTDADVSNGAK
jgi:hypothetical protein